MRAPGVEYKILVQGQTHFRCDRLRATIGVHECARRWQGARLHRYEWFVSCQRCPIGGVHAQPESPPAPQNATTPAPAPLKASLCIRCGRPATRLIWSELCPSCSNRETEWRRVVLVEGDPPGDLLDVFIFQLRQQPGGQRAKLHKPADVELVRRVSQSDLRNAERRFDVVENFLRQFVLHKFPGEQNRTGLHCAPNPHEKRPPTWKSYVE